MSTGFPVLGWKGDLENEGIIMDMADVINLEYEKDGKKRSGTKISPMGEVYATFSDGSQYLIGQIPVAQFLMTNNLTMDNKNTFEENESSGTFDGLGISVETVSGIIKRINKRIANIIDEDHVKMRNSKYELSINNSSNDYHFILMDYDGNTSYSKTINLYSAHENDAATGSVTPAPFLEEDYPGVLQDKSGKNVMIHRVNQENSEQGIDYNQGVNKFLRNRYGKS